jgi:hypothetical protein
VPKKKANQAAARSALVTELTQAKESGDTDEVFALLQLSYSDRSPVFGALGVGCVSTLKAVLDHGADPDLEFEGHSPLSVCIKEFASPVLLGRRVTHFSPGDEADVVRMLLMANATPTVGDLRQACHMKNPAVGKLLLDFGCSVEESGKGASDASPLLPIAAKHCPDLVFPLFARGADPFESAPDGSPTMAINPEAFREVRWKLLRMLFLVRQEAAPALNNNILGIVKDFYLGPLETAPPARGCTAPRSEKGKLGRSSYATAGAFDSLFFSSCLEDDPFDLLAPVPLPGAPWKYT